MALDKIITTWELDTQDAQKETKKVQSGFKDLEKQGKESTSKLEKNFKNLGTTITGALTVTALLAGIKKVIDINAELSDSIADVQKTTGLTRSAVDSLVESLKKIDTRTSLVGLLEIAKIGGQLGVAQEELLGFTEAIDKAAVALGDEFGGGAEEVASALGKLESVFKVSQQSGDDLGESLTKIGSSINALGAAGLATAPFLTDFSQRLGGIAANADIAITDILGLAAAAEQSGLQVEVSATAIGQLLNKFSTDTAKFAKLAGVGVEEFTELVNTDLNAALIKFLQGARGAAKDTTTFAKNLDALGLEGARATQVISALANNTDLIAEKQLLANDEFEKGTSLVEEFNIKNNTLAANLDKLGKAFVSFFQEAGIEDFFNDLVKGMTGTLRISEQIIQSETLSFWDKLSTFLNLTATGGTASTETIAKLGAEMVKTNEATKEAVDVNKGMVDAFAALREGMEKGQKAHEEQTKSVIIETEKQRKARERAEKQRQKELERRIAMEEKAAKQIAKIIEDAQIAAIEDELERNLAKLDQKEKQEIEALQKLIDNDLISRTEFEEARSAVEDDFARQRRETREETEQMEQEERDKKFEEDLEKQKEQAEKEAEIERIKQQQIFEIKNLAAQATLGILDLFVQSAKGQKRVALAEIAFNQGIAISELVKDSQKIGITPIEKAILFGTGLVQILTGIGKARDVIKNARGFKHGVVGLDGPGTETSDSIPAWLSRGETITSADKTKRYRGELEAMHDGNFDDYIAKTRIMPLLDKLEKKQRYADDIRLAEMFDDTKMVSGLSKIEKTSRKNTNKLIRELSRYNYFMNE